MAHWIAESRIAIEEIRLLTLKAAHSMDTLGSTGARKEVRPLQQHLQALSCPFQWARQVLWHLDGIENIGSFCVISGLKIIKVTR